MTDTKTVPCKPTEEIMLAAHDALEAAREYLRRPDTPAELMGQISTALYAIRGRPAAAPAHQPDRQGAGEPVGWQRLHPKHGWRDMDPEDVEHYQRQGQTIRALYAAAPPPLADTAMREALEFYASQWDWHPGDGEAPDGCSPGSPPTFYEAEPTSELKDDAGKKAREALATLSRRDSAEGRGLQERAKWPQ